jgi:hypothetical protein
VADNRELYYEIALTDNALTSAERTDRAEDMLFHIGEAIVGAIREVGIRIEIAIREKEAS